MTTRTGIEGYLTTDLTGTAFDEESHIFLDWLEEETETTYLERSFPALCIAYHAVFRLFGVLVSSTSPSLVLF